MKNNAFPKSLLQATRYFADPDVCVDFVASLRWPNGAVCAHCGAAKCPISALAASGSA